MSPKRSKAHQIILILIGVLVLVMGIILLYIPPAVFTDPEQGFQVLQSMQHGAAFNNLVAPDQGDISQNYSQFLTWWSPGQYLVPHFLHLVTGLNLGHAISLTIFLAEVCGLLGLYCFFRKLGFTPIISSLSLLFIFCQLLFMIPHVFYTGGEMLLFAFLGWYLYGCAAIERVNAGMILFVLFAGFVGFFCKSSFLWIYAAGLLCLWLRLASDQKSRTGRVKATVWIGLSAAVSLAAIYLLYISKGESPITKHAGLKPTAETFGYPLASPVLAGFSVDDMLNGLEDHIGKQLLNAQWSLVVLLAAAVISIGMVWAIMRKVSNNIYRLFLMVFYVGAVLFFGSSYLRQMDISMEARHFRIVGLLITPGIVYLAARAKPAYKVLFALVFTGIAIYSFMYLVNGYHVNNKLARGPLGIAQPDIDQATLNQVLKIDKEKRGITFVFIGDGIGLEIKNNRYIAFDPIPDSLRIDMNSYEYDGFAGPLYIVLPETYAGPKEKLVMKCFPNYAGWNESMLDDHFVLYVADRKKQ